MSSENQPKKYYDVNLFQRVVVSNDNIEDVKEAAKILHAQFPMLTLEVTEVPEPVGGTRFVVAKLNGQALIDKLPVMVGSIEALKNLEADDMEIAAIEGDRGTRYVYRKQITMDRLPPGQFVVGKMFESRHGGLWIERMLLQQRMMEEMQRQQAGAQQAPPGAPNMNGRSFRRP